ncbi:MAG: YdeI/OmpD-associated family protein, partial [Candidatus Limnocylindria bacterium]
PAAWAYWQARPPGYRRQAAFWILSAKQEATRERRLAALIEDSVAGRPVKPLRTGGD